MASDLLATKLKIPPPAPHAVPRPRLSSAIETGLPSHRLILVAAPAGYGKTTLLAQWAGTSAYPVAWFTVDERDTDVDRFLRGLVSAWETIQPDIRESPVGLLLSAPGPDRQAELTAFVNTASDQASHAAFVIDDVHLIDSPAINGTLGFLLDHLPPTLHLVLATRVEPSLALARRRARGELLEFRAHDLRLEHDEAEEFLVTGMGLEPAGLPARALNERVEGWAAGLQLVALSLRQQHTSLPGPIATGLHRHIVDFLSEEVIARLPESTQTFLFQTCVLDRLSQSLCEAVTGNPQSQAMLESLERANLFLMPMDDNRTWFRYHRVFADFLRQALPTHVEDVAALHARAARWHLEHELPEEAFQHALAGNDIDLACVVVETWCERKMFYGEVGVVEGWFNALPASRLEDRPELMIARAGFLILGGNPDAAIQLLERVELLPDREEPRVSQTLGRISALRCFMACFRGDLPGALVQADRAFQQLPADAYIIRANLYHAIGDTYRANHLWKESQASYLRVLETAEKSEPDSRIRAIIVHSYSALADMELRQGHLRAAEAYWTSALDVVQDRDSWGHFPLPVTGWIHLRLGELALERHELDLARDYLTRGMDRAELGREPQAMIAGRIIRSRLDLAEGRPDSAGILLDDAESLLETASFPDWAGRLDRCRVDLWLARQKWPVAMAWAGSAMAEIPPSDKPPPEATRLAIARVLLDAPDPDTLDQAGPLIDDLVDQAGQSGMQGVLIEALALRALWRERRGNHSGLMTDLERALHLAEPEGYVRRFVDIGPAMARLLRQASARQVMPEYVATLLDAFGKGPVLHGSGTAILAEPLSPRELDVLRLLATGLSNREIAQTLFVSPETVKKHTGGIYGKLGVHGRVQAVTVARSLSLLD